MKFHASICKSSGRICNIFPLKNQVVLAGNENPVEVNVTEIPAAVNGCYFAWKTSDGVLHNIHRNKLMVEVCSPDFFKWAIACGEGDICPVSVVELASD